MHNAIKMMESKMTPESVKLGQLREKLGIKQRVYSPKTSVFKGLFMSAFI